MILATRPSELQSRAGHHRDTGAARPSEQQRRTVPDLDLFQVILSSDYGIAYESLKVYECLKRKLYWVSRYVTPFTLKYLKKTFVQLTTSNLGPGPHPDEHEYELVNFQVIAFYTTFYTFPASHVSNRK